MSRRTVVKNDMSEVLYMREHPFGAVKGYYSHEIRVDPFGVKYDFPSTLYVDRNRAAMCSSEIVIFFGEGEAKVSLKPETFVRYVKLIFKVDERNLVVSGVRPRVTDICRFMGFGFLGREYSGRPEEEIIRSQIVYKQTNLTV